MRSMVEGRATYETATVKIRPGTGRGTARRVVEGGVNIRHRCVRGEPPPPASLVPLPVPGRIC